MHLDGNNVIARRRNSTSNKKNLPNTYDCGTQPIANPTTPRNNRIQRKLGAKELRKA